jgi:hypothetical protein
MIGDILKHITPEIVISTIQANPMLVPQVLQKFDAFVALGQALTTEQQMYISANMNKLGIFLRQSDVKEAIGIIAEAFIKKTSPEVTLSANDKPSK